MEGWMERQTEGLLCQRYSDLTFVSLDCPSPSSAPSIST